MALQDARMGDVLQLLQLLRSGSATVVAVILANKLPDAEKAPEWFGHNIRMYVKRARVDRLVAQRPDGSYVIIPVVGRPWKR